MSGDWKLEIWNRRATGSNPSRRSLLSAFLLGGLVSLSTMAATVTVTSTSDDGPGSLREAIRSQPSEIQFSISGTIHLKGPLPLEIGPGSLVFTGPGAANLVISGDSAGGVFSFQQGGHAVIKDLSIVNGNGRMGGGALVNAGTLSLYRCILANNRATNSGGAILNQGFLTLSACTFFSNSVVGVQGEYSSSTNTAGLGGAGYGGALCCQSGSAWITNCTFSGNLVAGGNGGDNSIGGGGTAGTGFGGAIFVDTNNTQFVAVNCTLADNKALGGQGGESQGGWGAPASNGYGFGGGYFAFQNGGEVAFFNSIIAGNSAVRRYNEAYGDFHGSANLFGESDGIVNVAADDLVAVSARLAPLQNNGGPVPTQALLPGSPALDAGTIVGAPATDARGVLRPQGARVDMGAFELGNQAITFPSLPDQTYGAPAFELAAFSSSHLPITLSIAGPATLSPDDKVLSLTGVGTVTVIADQEGNDIYLPALKVTNSFIVNPARLQLFAPVGSSRAYGEANPLLVARPVGLVSGDNIEATYVSTAQVDSPVGNYSLSPVLGDPDSRLANYNVETNAGTLTVTKATLPLVVTAPDQFRHYGETSLLGVSMVPLNLLNGDKISFTCESAATVRSAIGSYPILPRLSDPDSRLNNYNLETNTGVLTIDKAQLPLICTGVEGSRHYGETNPVEGTMVPANLLNDDNITYTCDPGVTVLSSIGHYPISVTLSDPDSRLENYNVQTNAGVFTITKALLPLICTAAEGSRHYGETNPLEAASLPANLLNDDNITYTCDPGVTVLSPIGDYPISMSLSDPDSRLENYNVQTNGGVFTITKALLPLIVTAPDATRHYAQTNTLPPASAPLNVLNHDDITVTYYTAATPMTPPGTYGPASAFAITSQLLDPDSRLTNYSVLITNGTLTVLSYATPTLSMVSPSNGSVFLAKMTFTAMARVSDPDETITNVCFRQKTIKLAQPIATPPFYSLTMSNVVTGSYKIKVDGVSFLGTTHNSEEIGYTVLATVPMKAGPIDTTSLEVLQTGLYQQDCWATNPTPQTLPAIRVEVSGLPAGVKLANATAITNGVPCIYYNNPMAPGAIVKLRLTYYVPDGKKPAPTIAIYMDNSGSVTANPTGAVLKINRILPFVNGTRLLDFATETNKTYYIQYSKDMVHWCTVEPQFTGKGGNEQWLDQGPPGTSCLPATEPSRFYRLLRLPSD